LEKAKTPFHTFSLPADRSLKVLLRGTPSNTPVKDIQNELFVLGFEITHIRQFLKNGKPLPNTDVHGHSSLQPFQQENIQSDFNLLHLNHS